VRVYVFVFIYIYTHTYVCLGIYTYTYAYIYRTVCLVRLDTEATHTHAPGTFCDNEAIMTQKGTRTRNKAQYTNAHMHIFI